MKKQAALEKRYRAVWRGLSVRMQNDGAFRLAMQCGAAFLGSFLLAGIRLLDRSVPAALALLAAMPFSLAAVCAYFGALAGYLAFWGTAGAFEPAAAGFLILAELCIFSGLLPRERKWFLPASSCALYALIGGLSLLSGGAQVREAIFLAARLGILAACTAAFSGALQEKTAAGRGVLALCILAGCSSIRLPGGIPLSAVLASGAAFLMLPGTEGLAAAAGCGLALDLTCGAGTSMTAVFSLAALACRGLSPEAKGLRAALFFGCCVSGALFTGGADAAMLIGNGLGLLLALAAPRELCRALEPERAQMLEARLSALSRVCDLMNETSRMLERTRARSLEPQSAAVFDRAAERVCRSCARWHDCWEENAAETYRTLSRLSARMLRRGTAERGDLAEFLDAHCCAPEEFLAAVNGALDDQRLRRQYQSRLSESRTVMADQYRILARLLQSAAEPPEGKTPALMYTPDLGFRARGVRGGTVSGDHGSSFSSGEWYYVLLCDGMGTGEEASRESAGAIRYLSELILAGVEPQEAMQMLSGAYILRADGIFSTIDLLQVSLVTGEGFLHKWGAAPSYLKLARRTARLGTPTPPPGIEAEGRCRPECIRVSMGGGEMLVMVSDGVDGAWAEERVREFSGRSPRELASGIVGCGGEDTDDRTAIAVCLRRGVRGKRRAPAGTRILSKLRSP